MSPARPPRGVTAPLDVALAWSEADHAFHLADGAAGGGRALDDAVAQAVIDRTSRAPESTPVRLTVFVPAGRGAEAHDLAAVIHADFARRADTAEYQLRRTLHAGRVSLLIGSAVLVVAMAIVAAMHRYAPEDRLTVLVQESLVIVGWVALWRPAELFLYDQWPIRRDLALLRRLARVDVRVVARDPADPRTTAGGPRRSGSEGRRHEQRS